MFILVNLVSTIREGRFVGKIVPSLDRRNSECKTSDSSSRMLVLARQPIAVTPCQRDLQK